MAQRPVRAVDSRLFAALIVEYAHRNIAGYAEVFEADRPTAALIQVALVEDPDFGVPAECSCALQVHEAAQHFAAARDAQRGAVDEIVVAGVHLPDPPIGSILRRDVEDRLEDLGHDVVAQQFWTVIEIKSIGSSGAEVPTFARVVQELIAGREQRTNLRNRVGGLVQFEQRRSRTAAVVGESQKDQHLIAVLMGIGVAPVGIADIPDTVLSATIRGVRNSYGPGVVWRRERKGSALWGHDRLNLTRIQSCTIRGPVLFNPSTRKRARRLRNRPRSRGDHQY